MCLIRFLQCMDLVSQLTLFLWLLLDFSFVLIQLWIYQLQLLIQVLNLCHVLIVSIIKNTCTCIYLTLHHIFCFFEVLNLAACSIALRILCLMVVLGKCLKDLGSIIWNHRHTVTGLYALLCGWLLLLIFLLILIVLQLLHGFLRQSIRVVVFELRESMWVLFIHTSSFIVINWIPRVHIALSVTLILWWILLGMEARMSFVTSICRSADEVGLLVLILAFLSLIVISLSDWSCCFILVIFNS